MLIGEFFYRFIASGNRYLSPEISIIVDKKMRKKKRENKLLELVHIPELDLNKLYDYHVLEKEFRDLNSCYMRQVNWMHY